jgi:hypothetical protein
LAVSSQGIGSIDRLIVSSHRFVVLPLLLQVSCRYRTESVLERKGIIHKDGDYWSVTPRARELGPEGVLRIINGEEADEEA